MNTDSEDFQKQKDALYEAALHFISENEIGGDEAVYQNDNVVLSAPEFIVSVCEIVGYWDWQTEKVEVRK